MCNYGCNVSNLPFGILAIVAFSAVCSVFSYSCVSNLLFRYLAMVDKKGYDIGDDLNSQICIFTESAQADQSICWALAQTTGPHLSIQCRSDCMCSLSLDKVPFLITTMSTTTTTATTTRCSIGFTPQCRSDWMEFDQYDKVPFLITTMSTTTTRCSIGFTPQCRSDCMEFDQYDKVPFLITTMSFMLLNRVHTF